MAAASVCGGVGKFACDKSAGIPLLAFKLGYVSSAWQIQAGAFLGAGVSLLDAFGKASKPACEYGKQDYKDS